MAKMLRLGDIHIYNTKRGTTLPASRVASLPAYSFSANSATHARTTCRSGQSSHLVMSRPVTPRQSNVQPIAAFRSSCRLSLRPLGSSAPRSLVPVGQGEERNGGECGDGEGGGYGEPGTGLEPVLRYRIECGECGHGCYTACSSCEYASFRLAHCLSSPKMWNRWIPSSTCKFSQKPSWDGKACVKFPVIFRIYDFGNADFSQLTGNAYRPAPRAVEATRGAGRFQSIRYRRSIFD